MNGGVGAAAPGAAAGPPPGHSRPTLPRRPPGAHRTLKQREREAPDVEWARALQHFAGCIRADLDDLHRRFIEENVVTFAAWKRLWRDARMSAAFHVEFWESTPTTTHKAILQQALDALVWCIEERGGEFGSEADVAALIGRVFALYCAYSVQLGAPKHKIDVDPQDWTALISVNCVMCGAGATMFPTAAREVRAMMHRLVVQENAFLRCLKGFGPSVRAQDRAERPRGGGGTGAHQDVSSIASSATEEDAIVQQSKLVQLKSLNDRYQEIMSRARSSGAAAVSSSGARLGGRRALPASQRPGSLLQGPGNNGEELIRSLTSYMEYKQNEEARRQDRVARAAAAREEEAKTILEVLASERDDSTNILALSDRGSVMSAPVSPVAPSVASSRREPRRRLDSEGSEAFLAELESELHADVSSDQVVAPLSALSPRNAATGRHSSAVSEISEADSDALADLERELEQSVDEAPSRAQEEAAPAKTRSPVRRKRGRSAASAGDAPRSTTRTAQASTQESAVVASRPMTERRPRDSTPSRIFVADSWAASSTAESDGLDAIQAELDAIPLATEASESAFFRPVRETNGAAITAAAKPKPKAKAKEKTRQPAGRANARNKASIAVTNRDQQLAAPPRRETRTRASSIASESSDLIAQLQTELDYPAAPLASTASNAKTSAKGIGPRRSSRLSSVASETGSNALEELERELNASTATLAGAPPLPLARQVETPSRIRGVASSKRPAQPTSSAAPRQTKRARTTTSASGTVSATQTPSKARGKQQVQSNPVAPQQSTQASAVSSDTESGGLSESMSELDAPVAAKPSPKQKPPTKKPGAKPTARRKPPTSSQLRSRTRRNSSDSEAALAELESKLHGNIASDRAVQQASSATPSTTTAVRSLISVNGIRPRRSSRLSSAASDSGSNALEELERELNASAATLAQAAQPPAANPTKTVPRKRGVASSKRPAHQDLPVARKKARSSTPENSTARREQRGPIIRQQSTRKSAVSSDAESDGLAELMSELETPVASATTPTQRKSPPAKKASSAQPRKTPSSSKAAAARPTPARSKVPPRAAAAAATSAAVGPRRSARLSSIASDTESDGLEDLMAELESAQAKEAAADVTQSSAQAVKNKATRAQGAKTDGKQAKRIPKAKTPAPTAPPRKPRTPRAPRPTQPKPSRNAAPQKVAPAAPLSSRRSTRSSSVAFDSDSDGLAELEAELQAGDS